MNDGQRKIEDGFVDRAIDGAVREMLDVEQQAGVRARVLRRIEERQTAPGFTRKVLWLGVPLAAAAILILAVLLPRGTEQVRPQAPTTAARVDPPPVIPPSPDLAPNPRVVEPARVVASTTRRPPVVTPVLGGAVTAASYEPAAPADASIEPLATLTPIQVAPVAQRALGNDEISLRPLNPIADVQIAPLTPPERRT